MRRFITATLLLMLAACSSPRSNLPAGPAAYDVIPAPTGNTLTDYRINALDELSITVFREPELSIERLRVDAAGIVQYPLIGTVRAAGRTAVELSSEITARLDARFVRNPQVTVAVLSSQGQRVTVEGSVRAPGVYEMGGNATLLEALARAQSPTDTAKLGEVVVFRVVEGQRMGAVFDLRRIRAGLDADPRIVGGDTVVVGFNQVKGAFRDFLSAAPLLTLFQVF
ncbi:polysaccharide biosynthesis/export family protein [Sphingomonas sp.]|jgi:polysaccharide export outer membrane protein|uniref:polysaccharide biosynthesis/export family protein n=1 Tax=Sphingomonas sp. TaxID=28214 RepID=UPI002D7F9DE6|nr:polysaccharide biosynthesis/export family protein [Sphingomonas sp.]HEU0043730.1 polysaccharide biosynthesis/export family protein [Sphingomonas sp.]